MDTTPGKEDILHIEGETERNCTRRGNGYHSWKGGYTSHGGGITERNCTRRGVLLGYTQVLEKGPVFGGNPRGGIHTQRSRNISERYCTIFYIAGGVR